MDFVYLRHPLLLLFAAVLLGMQVLTHFLPRFAFVLTAVSIGLHAVFCGCILVLGGTLYEFVLMLLASSVLSMALGAVETKKEQSEQPVAAETAQKAGEDAAK